MAAGFSDGFNNGFNSGIDTAKKDAAIAFAECAVQNGAEVIRDCKVLGFVKENDRITGVETSKGVIAAKYVVNAAGVYADEIAKMAGDDSFTITPRKGEYILFDKTACSSLVGLHYYSWQYLHWS